eukprot:jgi/Chlat1/8554/Chrsp82S07946
MDGLIAEVEQASAALEDLSGNAQAQATLLGLRTHPQFLQACFCILDRCALPGAQFQAACALRGVLPREWPRLSSGDRQGLREHLIALAARADTQHYVRGELLGSAAAALKLAWEDLSRENRDAFFQQVDEAVRGERDDMRLVGLMLLNCIVEEFLPPTASALGLSAEYHERCGRTLQARYLPRIYSLAAHTAHALVASRPGDRACIAAFQLMAKILTWDFRPSPLPASAAARATDATCLQPGTSWRELLLAPHASGWLLELYAALRHAEAPGTAPGALKLKKLHEAMSSADPALAAACRQIVVQLAGLRGDIFADVTSKVQHAGSLLQAVAEWLSPVSVIVQASHEGEEGELLDACRALSALAAWHSPADLALIPHAADALRATAHVSMQCARLAFKEDTDCWALEIFDILLNMWTRLVQAPEELPPAVDAAYGIFEAYVHAALEDAAAGAHAEDDALERVSAALAARDETLAMVAILARASPMPSLTLLQTALAAAHSRIAACASSGNDASEPLEQLYFLLLMSGHVIADDAQGETPSIPESFLIASAAAGADAANDPALSLSLFNFRIACETLDPSARVRTLSPRLMEGLVWYLARWTETYLMPEQNAFPRGKENAAACALVASFSAVGGGPNVLDALVQIAWTTLTAWPGEVELETVTCSRLLPALVRRRELRRTLLRLDTWRQLERVFTEPAGPIASLSAALQRDIQAALCRAVAGEDDKDAAAKHIEALLQPLIGELRGIFEHPDARSSKHLQRPDVMARVAVLLERLRGSARATHPRTQASLFHVSQGAMDAALAVLDGYRSEASVALLALKWAVELAEAHAPYLALTESRVLNAFALHAVQAFAQHHLQDAHTSTLSTFYVDKTSDAYRGVKAVLGVLNALTAKDTVDFARQTEAAANEAVQESVQVVLVGLGVAMPLMSAELLKFPKLCQRFIAVASHACTVHPAEVASLAPEALTSLVSAVDFALSHQDADVVQSALEAVGALAAYYCEQQSSQPNAGTGTFAESIRHFQALLLRLLLLEDFNVELMGQAEDALLALIVADRALFRHHLEEIVRGVEGEEAKRGTSEALRALVESSERVTALNRQTRQAFRAESQKHVVAARSWLRTK